MEFGRGMGMVGIETGMETRMETREMMEMGMYRAGLSIDDYQIQPNLGSIMLIFFYLSIR